MPWHTCVTHNSQHTAQQRKKERKKKLYERRGRRIIIAFGFESRDVVHSLKSLFASSKEMHYIIYDGLLVSCERCTIDRSSWFSDKKYFPWWLLRCTGDTCKCVNFVTAEREMRFVRIFHFTSVVMLWHVDKISFQFLFFILVSVLFPHFRFSSSSFAKALVNINYFS